VKKSIFFFSFPSYFSFPIWGFNAIKLSMETVNPECKNCIFARPKCKNEMSAKIERSDFLHSGNNFQST